MRTCEWSFAGPLLRCLSVVAARRIYNSKNSDSINDRGEQSELPFNISLLVSIAPLPQKLLRKFCSSASGLFSTAITEMDGKGLEGLF